MNEIESSVSGIKGAIDVYKEKSPEIAEIDQFVREFDSALETMRKMDEFLNDMLNEITLSIQKVDSGIRRLEGIEKQLDETDKELSVFTAVTPGMLVSPLITFFKPLYTATTTIGLFFPTLLVLVMAFIGLLLSNIFILNETQSKGYLRNFLTPAPEWIFVCAYYSTILVLVLFQVLVLLLVGKYNFGINVFENWPGLFLGVFLMATIFIEIGMILGYIFKSAHLSILSATFLGLALFLFSGIIVPPESMPPLVNLAVSFNPLVFGETIFRKIFFLDMMPYQDTVNIVKVIAFIFVLTIGVFIAKNINKNQTIR
ncbi:unnamed protein product [marine sediment metagenome]|uniref:ABC-2 type transporter transmembrane domain-containing protein n=1 Tax=marine sediment metagenome TaxID=412755 RepID=X1R1B2_9ZZZZ